MLEGLIFTVAGIVGGALVTRWYDRRQATEAEAKHKQLRDEVGQLREWVERVATGELSPDELEWILHERGYFPTEFGILPSKCPECGSDTRTRGGTAVDHRYDEEYPWLRVSCTNPECDWADER